MGAGKHISGCPDILLASNQAVFWTILTRIHQNWQVLIKYF
jgi:hypothetical protein